MNEWTSISVTATLLSSLKWSMAEMLWQSVHEYLLLSSLKINIYN